MITTDGKTVVQVVTEIMAKLVEQGRVCIKSGGTCAYSDGKGGHCAVGWLLEEGSEAMDFKGNSDDLIFEFNLGPNDDWMRAHAKMLYELQGIHDHAGDYDLQGDINLFCRDYGEEMRPAFDGWLELSNKMLRERRAA